MNTRPSITVVIPAHNAETYLGEAIESVLAQREIAADLIVVDDGSTDGTAAIATGFNDRVTYLYQRHSGPGAARNLGIEAVTSEFVAFLDGDDVWPVDSLALRHAALCKDPHASAAFGHAEQFTCDLLSSDERALVAVPGGCAPARTCGTMLARRELFDHVGLFPTEREAGEFIEWYLAATQAGTRFLMLDDLVLRRRVHGTNLGRRQTDGSRLDYVRIIREDLARRRAAGGA